MSKYRKVPMTMPHCAWHPRCYARPKFNVTWVLGDYCERHADELIAKHEQWEREIAAPPKEFCPCPRRRSDESDVSG